MDNEEIIEKLADENAKLRGELQETKEHLKRYTAPASRKLYYENNKEIIIERVKKCNYKPTPEQKKIYNKQAYLQRKEKLQNEKHNHLNI
jgi:hypothetical protein